MTKFVLFLVLFYHVLYEIQNPVCVPHLVVVPRSDRDKFANNLDLIEINYCRMRRSNEIRTDKLLVSVIT